MQKCHANHVQRYQSNLNWWYSFYYYDICKQTKITRFLKCKTTKKLNQNKIFLCSLLKNYAFTTTNVGTIKSIADLNYKTFNVLKSSILLIMYL